MSSPRPAEHFHEFPLMAFSALGIAGAGLAAAHPLAIALGFVGWMPERSQAGMSIFLLGSGLIISLVHLGRPKAILQAAGRTNANALSSEVSAAILIGIACLGIMLCPESGRSLFYLWGIAASSGTCFLLALGLVYNLRGQLAWRGTVVISPVLLGFIFGLMASSAYAGKATMAVVAAIFALVALDAAFAIARWVRLEKVRTLGQPVHPEIFLIRHRILFVRFMSVTLAPAISFIAAMPMLALVTLGTGILIDRFAFYGLAIRQTPESEIDRIESLLKQEFSDE